MVKNDPVKKIIIKAIISSGPRGIAELVVSFFLASEGITARQPMKLARKSVRIARNQSWRMRAIGRARSQSPEPTHLPFDAW